VANRGKLRLGVIWPNASARSTIFTVEQDIGEKGVENVDLYVTEEGGTWRSFHASIHPGDANQIGGGSHQNEWRHRLQGALDLSKPVVPAIAIAVHNDLRSKNVHAFQDVDDQQKPLDHQFLYKRGFRSGHFHLLVVVLVNENKVASVSSMLPLDSRYFLPYDDTTYATLVYEVVVPEDHLGIEVCKESSESRILAKLTWVEPGISISFDGIEHFRIPKICSLLQPINEEELKQIEQASPESEA